MMPGEGSDINSRRTCVIMSCGDQAESEHAPRDQIPLGCHYTMFESKHERGRPTLLLKTTFG